MVPMGRCRAVEDSHIGVRIERNRMAGLPSGGGDRMLRLGHAVRARRRENAMSRLRGDSFGVRRGRNSWSHLGAAALMALVPVLGFAQNCTTQAKMNGLLRSSLSDAVLSMATDVKSGNVDKLKSEAIELAKVVGSFDIGARSTHGRPQSADAKRHGSSANPVGDAQARIAAAMG